MLIGQSLISATQNQGYVLKFQQYEVAEQSFISKFKQLPGDSNLFVPPGNNRMLDGATGSPGQFPYSERVLFACEWAGNCYD